MTTYWCLFLIDTSTFEIVWEPDDKQVGRYKGTGVPDSGATKWDYKRKRADEIYYLVEVDM